MRMTAFFAPVLAELGARKLLVVSLLRPGLDLGSDVASLLEPAPPLDPGLTHQVVPLVLPVTVAVVSRFTVRINFGGRMETWGWMTCR